MTDDQSPPFSVCEPVFKHAICLSCNGSKKEVLTDIYEKLYVIDCMACSGSGYYLELVYPELKAIDE